MTADRSKVRCCKEQYCIGTWNVRLMNQAKLEVLKQEMVRVKTDILGISELQWTGMGEFNSDDHYIYYCGQESLRKEGFKRVRNSVLGCNLKNDRMISVHFQGKSFNITLFKGIKYTRRRNGKPLQYSCLENPMNSVKRKKDRTLKDELPKSVGAQYDRSEEHTSELQSRT